MKNKSLFLALLLILVLVGGVFIYLISQPQPPADRWDQQAKDETRMLAEPLVFAVERYRDDHGVPPQDLGQLVPEYIAEVPEPIVGRREWDYMSKGSKYYLSVSATDDDLPSLPVYLVFGQSGYDARVFIYNPLLHEWRVDD